MAESLMFLKLKEAVKVIQLILHRQHQLKVNISSTVKYNLENLKHNFIRLYLQEGRSKHRDSRSHQSSYNLELDIEREVEKMKFRLENERLDN